MTAKFVDLARGGYFLPVSRGLGVTKDCLNRLQSLSRPLFVRPYARTRTVGKKLTITAQ